MSSTYAIMRGTIPLAELKAFPDVFKMGYIPSDRLRDLAEAKEIPYDISDRGWQAEELYASLDRDFDERQNAKRKARHARKRH